MTYIPRVQVHVAVVCNNHIVYYGPYIILIGSGKFRDKSVKIRKDRMISRKLRVHFVSCRQLMTAKGMHQSEHLGQFSYAHHAYPARRK